MKQYVLSIGLSFLLVSCAAEPLPAQPSGDIGTNLTTASDLLENAASELNSHAGEEQWSRLQPMYGYFQTIPHKWLTVGLPESATEQKFANYPRIKKMQNGEYIMFWHGGQFGSRIWSSISKDFKTWSTPVMHYQPESVTIDGEQDWTRYVNMDAVVLDNGDILAVASFRASNHYSEEKGCGLVLMRSSDNGRSWSKPEAIYDGANWEPYLLQLPDGRVQCYFTDATPRARNSGTSIMISEDRGRTWSKKMRVSRQYKYDYDGPYTEYTGIPIFTDQMPCFRVLNDGKTIAGFLEARLETPLSINGASYCKMSMVYNDGLDWKDIGETGEGPERRYSNVIKGGAGYISTFPSGEVVISMNESSRFRMKMLDRHAELPGDATWTSDWLLPFSGAGFWGCTEVDSPQTLVAAMHCGDGLEKGGGMQMGRFWLNHRIDAVSTVVTLDGKGDEWTSKDALYISSMAGDETIIRSSRDDENLYLLVETASVVENPDYTLYLRLNTTGETDVTAIRLLPSGDLVSTGIKVGYASSEASSKDGRKGVVTEIAVPLKDLKAGSGDYIRIYAETVTPESTASFSLSDKEKPSTWQRIRLK